MSMIAKGSWSALLIALTMTSAVVAQAQAPDPKGCTPQERSSQALNQGADKNAGVICPPDIDPAIKAPTQTKTPGRGPGFAFLKTRRRQITYCRSGG